MSEYTLYKSLRLHYYQRQVQARVPQVVRYGQSAMLTAVVQALRENVRTIMGVCVCVCVCGVCVYVCVWIACMSIVLYYFLFVFFLLHLHLLFFCSSTFSLNQGTGSTIIVGHDGDMDGLATLLGMTWTAAPFPNDATLPG